MRYVSLFLACLAAAPATQPATPFRPTVTVQATDDLLTIHSNGLPDHSTGKYPNDKNPNPILAQNYTFYLPAHPKLADHITPLPMGPIGVAINGVPFYNPYTARGEDASKLDVYDDCCGHPDSVGRYHYHLYPRCLHTSFVDPVGTHSPLIGYAFDGFPIYGPNGDNGKPPTDLDPCNGHSSPALGYHYHVSHKFPYILGGYHGTPDQRNFDHPAKAFVPQGPG